MTSTASDVIVAFISYIVDELRYSAQTGLSYAGELYAWERWLAQPERGRSIDIAVAGDARDYASELAHYCGAT